MTEELFEHERLVRAAAFLCGELIEPGLSFLETKLVRAFCEAIEQEEPRAVAAPSFEEIPFWDPQPGGTDIVVGAAGLFRGQLLIEAKVDDIEQTVWDLFKMACAALKPDVRSVGGSSPGEVPRIAGRPLGR